MTSGESEGRLTEAIANVNRAPSGDFVALLLRVDAELRAMGPRPTRFMVHDAHTERLLVEAIPRAPEGRLDPFAPINYDLIGLRLEIDPEDAPEPGVVYVDFRPASEWSNRR